MRGVRQLNSAADEAHSKPSAASRKESALSSDLLWLWQDYFCWGLHWVASLRWFQYSRPVSPPRHNPFDSFDNLSGDPSQEYLSDGLTEEMITQLGESAPDQLGASSKYGQMQYKDTHKAVEKMGE